MSHTTHHIPPERKHINVYYIISSLAIASPGPGQRNNYFWLFIDRRLGGSFVCGNVFPMFGSLYFAHISSGEKIKIFSDKTNWLFVPERSSKSVLFHFSSQFESLMENTVFLFHYSILFEKMLLNSQWWGFPSSVLYSAVQPQLFNGHIYY